jgi:hypothetical protein
MKRFFLFVGALHLLLSMTQTFGDQVFESIQVTCDPKRMIFEVFYSESWNSSASSPEAITVPGRYHRVCLLGNTKIRTDIVLNTPGGGTCGATPGGIVSIKYGDTEVINRELFNHCTSNRLDNVHISEQKDTVNVMFCGTRYAEMGGIQEGCFTEKFKKNSMPKRILLDSTFPYSKFTPTTLCSHDEQVAFSCRTANEKTISLCESLGFLQYRFGEVGKEPELIYPELHEHPEKHFKLGQGPQNNRTFIHFKINDYTYSVIFTGGDEGVLVEKENKKVEHYHCYRNIWHDPTRLEILRSQ